MLTARSCLKPVLSAALALPLSVLAAPHQASSRPACVGQAGLAQPRLPGHGAPLACHQRQLPAYAGEMASPVPEPETWTILVLGLGMVAYAARRAACVGANRTVSSSERHGGAKLPFSN
jgi:hypothetical protein